MKSKKTYYEVSDEYGRKRVLTNKLRRALAYIQSCQFDYGLLIVRYTCDAATGEIKRREIIDVSTELGSDTSGTGGTDDAPAGQYRGLSDTADFI